MTSFFSYNVPYVGRYIDPFIILVSYVCTPHSNMWHKSSDTKNPEFYLSKLPDLLSYTYATCRQIKGPLI